MAIDQIAQSGLSSLKVIYYSAQLFSARPVKEYICQLTTMESIWKPKLEQVRASQKATKEQ